MFVSFSRLPSRDICIRVYSDFSYERIYDRFSQMKYLTFFLDNDKNCQAIVWSPRKAGRVKRSVTCNELMDFTQTRVILQIQCEKMDKEKVLEQMYTDC